MATRKNKAVRRNTRTNAPKPTPAEAAGWIEIGGRHYTRAGLESHGRTMLEKRAELEQHLAKEREAEAQECEDESKPYPLDRDYRQAALTQLSRLNMAAVSVHRLAVNVGNTTD